DIKDSGIEGAVEKEISVNLVDDAVRRIVKENAIELLNDEYKEKINHDVVDYIANNPDKYKGADGKSLKYADLTEQQKENLKSNITDQAVTDFVIEDESISEDKLTDNTIGVEKVNFIKSSRNLLNKNDVISRKNLSTTTGELITSSTASVFNKWFEVTPGDPYYSLGLYARAFYDTNKRFISGTTGNGSFTIPDNTRFVRFSTTSLEEAQLNHGTEAKPYDEYFEPYLVEDIAIKGLSNNSIGTAQIKNNSVTVDKVDFINRSNNLIDKNKISTGYAFSSDGSITENSRHAISDYVPIIPNQTYTVSSNSSRVNFYDEKKEYIGQFFSSDFTATFTTPPNARYLRTNITISRYEDAMLNEGTEILPYEDWHEPVLEGITDGNNIDSEKLTEEIIKKIKEEENTQEENTIVKLPKNLIDKNSLIQGKSLNSKGEISENSMFYITDYIPIKENETYTASSSPQNRVIFYDESKNYIDYEYITEDTITFTTPEKTAYVRLNVYTTFKDTPMLNKGTELLPYEDWHEPVVEEITDGNNIDSEKLTEEIIKKIKEEIPIKDRKTFTLDTSLDLNYTPETIQGCSDDDPLPMGEIQYTDMYD
ncbi:MAG: hypothetical protein L0L95_13535, partial [Staphylococcus equorum]|nr:hypothetical protein [Staphylococcus equorum]